MNDKRHSLELGPRWYLTRSAKVHKLRYRVPEAPKQKPSVWAKVLTSLSTPLKAAPSEKVFTIPDTWADYTATLSNRNGVLTNYQWVEFKNQNGTSPIQLSTEDLLKHKHIFLGHSEEFGDPVLLARTILDEGGHTMGTSGTGKTAKGVTPLVVQLILFGDSAAVIIDLKGDMSLFQAAKLSAEKVGRTFKYFTTEVGLSTYVFNPLSQGNDQFSSTGQMAESLVEALGLDHGEGYGKSFYSRVNRRRMRQLLREYAKRGNAEGVGPPHLRPPQGPSHRPKSFRELLNFHRSTKMEHKEEQDCFELTAVLELMADIEQLNVTDQDNRTAFANAIRMPEVIEKHQVVYFNLAQAVEGAASREIGQLIINSVFRSCYQRDRESKLNKTKTAHPGRTYLVIDEFQDVVGKSFVNVMEQSRSLNLSIILSHQHLGQLNKGSADQDFRDVVKATRFKQFFSAEGGSETDEYVMKASGTSLLKLHQTGPLTDLAEGARETTTTHLMPNDLIRVGDDMDLSIVHIRAGHGYSYYGGFPFILKSGFHITEEEMNERRSLPWPDGSDQTITVDAWSTWEPKLSPAQLRQQRRAAKRNANRAKGDLDDVQAPQPIQQTARLGKKHRDSKNPKQQGELNLRDVQPKISKSP